MPPSATKASIRGGFVVHASPEYPLIKWLWRTYQMSQKIQIIFEGVWDIYDNIYKSQLWKIK